MRATEVLKKQHREVLRMFKAKTTVLRQLVEHHIEEEGHEMFTLASKLGSDETADLGRRLEEESAAPH